MGERNAVFAYPKRGRALLAAAVALMALLVPVAPGRAAEKGLVPEMTWGVDSKTQSRDASSITDLGAKWVRLNVSWSDWTEPSPGSYSRSAFRSLDRGVSLATQAGAKVIVMVNESPSWARDSSNPNAPPRNVADYAKFVSYVANRWKGQVAGYEVWNEPNLGGFFMPPGAYASMLTTTAPAIRVADPAAKVLFAGLAYNDYAYLEAAYAAAPGLGGYFDVMGAHPYARNGGSPDVYWRGPDGRLTPDSFAGYRELRATNLAHGADKPIWITEIGWSTENGDDRGVTPQQQAAYLTLAYQCLEQDPYVQVATYYNLRNNWWARDSNDWESQLGLMTTNFTPKPAYAAFKSYAPGAGGCAYHEASPPPAQAGPPTPAGTSTVSAATVKAMTAPSLDLRVRRARTARRARAAARGGFVLVSGRIAGASPGRVLLTFSYRAGRGYRTAFATSRPVGARGTFSKLVRLPRSGRWRILATFLGNRASTVSASDQAYIVV